MSGPAMFRGVRGLVVCVLLALTVAAPAQATITFGGGNPGFESGDLGGWGWNYDTPTVTTESHGLSAPSGRYFALMAPSCFGSVDMYQNLTGQAGDVLTGWLSTPAGSNTGNYAWVQIYDEVGQT